MSLHQPVPFEYKHGKLVDAFGETVLWRNKHNLEVIAEYMNKDTNPDVSVILNEIEDSEGEEHNQGYEECKKHMLDELADCFIEDMELMKAIRKHFA